jgi:hypothetical protein
MQDIHAASSLSLNEMTDNNDPKCMLEASSEYLQEIWRLILVPKNLS